MAHGYPGQREEILPSYPLKGGNDEDYRRILDNPSFFRSDKPPVRSPLRIWASAMLISVIVFGVALGIQWFIYDRYLHEAGIRVVGSAIAACVSIVLVMVLGTSARNQRLREVRRLETIALLNHYIRNSLQAIVSSSGSSNSTETIRAAVDRIQWALSEVLPQVQPERNRSATSGRS